MATPTFNGQKLFSQAITPAGGGATTYTTEGVLWVQDYDQITQTLHFNGEKGNRTLFHGYADLNWKFQGNLASDSLTDLQNALAAIQTAIDANTSDSSTYSTLVDSFGTVYDYAQIRKLSILDIHVCAETSGGGGGGGGGTQAYVARIVVTGVISGNVHQGATT